MAVFGVWGSNRCMQVPNMSMTSGVQLVQVGATTFAILQNCTLQASKTNAFHGLFLFFFLGYMRQQPEQLLHH
jgi:hypothetical protein